jgi:hypothetical protein
MEPKDSSQEPANEPELQPDKPIQILLVYDQS